MGGWGDGDPPLAPPPPRRGIWGDGGMGGWEPTPRPSQEGNLGGWGDGRWRYLYICTIKCTSY
ncbi:MAG: hypothetical protein F6K48_17410 [Okeania sp. SIO3H1]|nr:hypothetical protein [Okeania sp. SIO3H1]